MSPVTRMQAPCEDRLSPFCSVVYSHYLHNSLEHKTANWYLLTVSMKLALINSAFFIVMLFLCFKWDSNFSRVAYTGTHSTFPPPFPFASGSYLASILPIHLHASCQCFPWPTNSQSLVKHYSHRCLWFYNISHSLTFLPLLWSSVTLHSPGFHQQFWLSFLVSSASSSFIWCLNFEVLKPLSFMIFSLCILPAYDLPSISIALSPSTWLNTLTSANHKLLGNERMKCVLASLALTAPNLFPYSHSIYRYSVISPVMGGNATLVEGTKHSRERNEATLFPQLYFLVLQRVI